MTFRNVLLPIACDLQWNSAPGFSTRVVRTDNGQEYRTAEWDSTLARATLRYNARNQTVWRQIEELFQIVHGMAYSFKVRDPRKFTALPGEGIFVSNQATLRLTLGAYTIDKTITKLGADVVVNTGSVDPLTGIGTGSPTTWEGTFYLCMRFGTDELTVSGVERKAEDGTFIAAFDDVPLIEVPFD